LPHPKHVINAPAVAEPHQGTSYNPSIEAYQELLLQAHEKEEKRVFSAERFSPGMKLDTIMAEDEEAKGEEDTLLPQKKVPSRGMNLCA